jgi:hypothetical protein
VDWSECDQGMCLPTVFRSSVGMLSPGHIARFHSLFMHSWFTLIHVCEAELGY